MDVIEAIQTRVSTRAFLHKPVPREVIMQILEVATRSPSGGNGQPWEIFVAAGQAADRIRGVYLERARLASAPPMPPGPPPPEAIRQRMTIIREERMRLLGLDPADPASMKTFAEIGARLYDAPVFVIICMEKGLQSRIDLGILTGAICLAAHGMRVASLVAGSLLIHQDAVREVLHIPENLEPVIGICLGYADPDQIINTYHSPRRPIAEVVRYMEE